MRRRRREGTLVVETERVEFEKLPSWSALDEFLSEARQLAAEVLEQCGMTTDVAAADPHDEQIPLRARQAARLARGISALERHLSKAGDQERLLAIRAAEAAILFSGLAKELRLDTGGKHGKRTTRTKYFAAKAIARTRAELAELLDFSEQSLRKWERRNLGDDLDD